MSPKTITAKAISALWCAAIAGACSIALAAPVSAQTTTTKPAATNSVPDTALAATVNGEKIMMAKVNVVLNRIKARRPDIPQEDLDGMRSDIIEDLISERLLLQQAVKDGLMPSDKKPEDKQKLDDALWKLRQAFPSQSAYNKYLKDNNKTEAELRVALAEGMAGDAYGKKLTADLAVSFLP